MSSNASGITGTTGASYDTKVSGSRDNKPEKKDGFVPLIAPASVVGTTLNFFSEKKDGFVSSIAPASAAGTALNFLFRS